MRIEVPLDLPGKPPSRELILIFNPGPKESNKIVLPEPLKLTILGPCVGMPSRRLKLFFFTPDAAKPFSVDSF